MNNYSEEERQFLAELDIDFKDDADYQALSQQEKLRIIRVMAKMMDMGMAAVYGDEDTDEPDANVPCKNIIDQCQAKCCTFIFALTKEEVKAGLIKSNPDKPYFIARDADKYCPHLNRGNWQCSVWHNRPLRCRRYDCRDFADDVWPDGIPLEIRK